LCLTKKKRDRERNTTFFIMFDKQYQTTVYVNTLQLGKDKPMAITVRTPAASRFNIRVHETRTFQQNICGDLWPTIYDNYYLVVVYYRLVTTLQKSNVGIH